MEGVVKYDITEGVAGMWHYHLRVEGEQKALCGATVMRTSVPPENWNRKIAGYHLPRSFCEKCEALREKKR